MFTYKDSWGLLLLRVRFANYTIKNERNKIVIIILLLFLLLLGLPISRPQVKLQAPNINFSRTM